MPEDAVLDLPEVEAEPLEAVETPAVETEEHEPVAETVETAETKGDERVMPQWIRNLKAADPAAFKEAKAIFFGKRATDEKLKDFDLDGTKSFLEEHGGRESLNTVLGELKSASEEYASLTQAVQSGDPTLGGKIADVAGENFPKIATAVMQTWAQKNPEAYDAAISGAFAQTIAAAGVPAFLDKMEMMLKYNDTASFGVALTQLKDWAGGFSQKAQAQIQAAANPQQKQGETAEDVRRQVAQEKWSTDTSSARLGMIDAEMAHFTAKNADPDLKEIATERITKLVKERMRSDAGYNKNLNALTNRGDYAGAMLLFKSREGEAVKEIGPTVCRKIYGNPGPVAVVAPEKKTPVVRKSTPVGKESKFDAIWAS